MSSLSIHDYTLDTHLYQVALYLPVTPIMRQQLKRIMLLLVGVVLTMSSYSQHVNTTKRIDSLMVALDGRGQFNGAIIVSIDKQLIYRNAFGQDHKNQQFSLTTPSSIVSLSKGFTAMLIMMLAEEGKLTYDDPIINYLPELNSLLDGITIRHLLTHTSGIPDVDDLGIDNPRLTNATALKKLSKLKSTFREPGKKYRYSATGYLLLATIVERISKKTFSDLLTQKILDPLEMNNTSLSGRAVGMGGMRSTVDDLLKWEQSFYSEGLICQPTLVEAFIPFPVKEGTSTYGFGWNISPKDESKLIWNAGNTGEYGAFMGRVLPEGIAIIMLTEGDTKKMEISDAIINIIKGRPYSLPTMPIVDKLYYQITRHGIEKAMEYYESLKTNDFKDYDFSEPQLNSLGYKLLDEGRYMEAIYVFRLNVGLYPNSSNVFYSLGEGYYRAGDRDKAVRCYEKALELDPANLESLRMLRRLKN